MEAKDAIYILFPAWRENSDQIARDKEIKGVIGRKMSRTTTTNLSAERQPLQLFVLKS